MSIITVAYPSLDLMQQVLNTPHVKGGGGHQGGNGGFGTLVEAQLGSQAAAAMATAPRVRVEATKLVQKKDEHRKEQSDQDESEEDEAQAQAREQSSSRSLWA